MYMVTLFTCIDLHLVTQNMKSYLRADHTREPLVGRGQKRLEGCGVSTILQDRFPTSSKMFIILMIKIQFHISLASGCIAAQSEIL